MNLPSIVEPLQHGTLLLVFVNVLLQQLGLPVPAVPTLLVAGSLAATPGPLGRLLAAAMVASVAADWLWYHAGRRFGYRLLNGLCRISINPSSCVTQTEARFMRWGIGSLVLAKFIPGFSTVAPPIAGALRMHQPAFLLAAATGAALWAGAALVAGWVLRDAVHGVIAALERNSGAALAGVALVAAAWIGWKLWQKHRFRRWRDVPHVTPAELLAAMRSDVRPLLLDLRGAVLAASSGPIAGATVAEHEHLLEAVADWPKERLIVTLCACPEDAGAIVAARRLLQHGYLSVKPLRGGYDAWLAAQPDGGVSRESGARPAAPVAPATPASRDSTSRPG